MADRVLLGAPVGTAEVPDTLPATFGIVRRIRVAPSYRDVRVSPKWFRHRPLADSEMTSETGILVEIELVRPPAP